ncbi:unnamed protein product [Gongylonema pulchrum]|uniref:Histone acetyltransferase GCN5 n=1 Tax=Gongylonema pulchrum TaxID=637853 RepID=A0A183DQ59_9BILA|nr:unnamed protein product [Gongylonema pulchrum]
MSSSRAASSNSESSVEISREGSDPFSVEPARSDASSEVVKEAQPDSDESEDDDDDERMSPAATAESEEETRSAASISNDEEDDDGGDVVGDDDGDENGDENEELTPDARSDSIFSAENEDDATLAASASPRKKRGIKITDETRKFLENENILRRSGRQRRENSGTNASEQRPLKRPLSHSEEVSDEEEEEEEFEITPMLPKTTQKSLKALPKKKVRKHSANSNGDSDGARPARRNKAEARKNRINYRDISSGEEVLHSSNFEKLGNWIY